MFAKRNWYTQRHYCCQVISALNAAQWFGLDPPWEDTPAYYNLFAMAECRSGPARNMDHVATLLGLNRVAVKATEYDVFQYMPVALSSFFTPGGWHDYLIVDYKRGKFRCLNYDTHEPVSWVRWRDIHIPTVNPYALIYRPRGTLDA